MRTEQAAHLKILPPQPLSELQTAVDGFYLDREAARCSPATLIWYHKYVGALNDWLSEQGIQTLTEITPFHLRRWLVELQRGELGDRSLHHHASAVRSFFNFCVREELLTASPMQKVKIPPLPKDILPAFAEDDVKKLLGVCKIERDRAIVLCLLDTGCRAAEFAALNVGDVDKATGAVMIRHGKGNKDRMTYLGAKAGKALWRYLASRKGVRPDEPLWLSETTGERLTAWGLRLLLKRLGRLAGVANCHPHTFRRTFALWSLRAGMNIYALQQIMGHSDLTVLRKYLALVEQDLREAHRKFGAVDNML